MRKIFVHTKQVCSDVTFVSFNEEQTKCMLEMISVFNSILKSVLDFKTITHGIRSDHFALSLIFANYSIKYKVKSVSRGEVNKD